MASVQLISVLEAARMARSSGSVRCRRACGDAGAGSAGGPAAGAGAVRHQPRFPQRLDHAAHLRQRGRRDHVGRTRPRSVAARSPRPTTPPSRSRSTPTPNCTGPVAATGTSAELEGAGIQVTVAPDSTTTFYATQTDPSDPGNPSLCSTPGLTYTQATPPNPPVVTAVTPVGPADDNNPHRDRQRRSRHHHSHLRQLGLFRARRRARARTPTSPGRGYRCRCPTTRPPPSTRPRSTKAFRRPARPPRSPIRR